MVKLIGSVEELGGNGSSEGSEDFEGGGEADEATNLLKFLRSGNQVVPRMTITSCSWQRRCRQSDGYLGRREENGGEKEKKRWDDVSGGVDLDLVGVPEKEISERPSARTTKNKHKEAFNEVVWPFPYNNNVRTRKRLCRA